MTITEDPKFYIDHINDACFPEQWGGKTWAVESTEAGGYVSFHNTFEEAEVDMKRRGSE